MRSSNIVFVISILLIMLFAYTGISKWINFNDFINDISRQPFPQWIKGVLVVILPVAEVLIALCLMHPHTNLQALNASVVLIGLFSLYSILVLLKAFPYVPCPCGGIIKTLTWNQHLILNLFFLAISIAGVLLTKKSRFISPTH